LVFDRERPGVGKSCAAVETDVLDGEKKFPERKHFRVLAPRWQRKINGENNEVGGQDAQGAPSEEASEVEAFSPMFSPTARGRAVSNGEMLEELAADQVTAEDKEKIDADPAETMDAARQREAHDSGVVDDDNDDREGAEKIETRLALAIGKARVDSGLSTASL
jgi:hypothetical protein